MNGKMFISSKFVALSLLVVLLSCQPIACSITTSDLHLLIGLPLEGGSETGASWERGSEILPGVHGAVESINKRRDVLPGYKLQTSNVDVGRCGTENYNFILQYVNATYHQDINFIGVVGIFCPYEVAIIQLPNKTKAASKDNLKLAIEVSESHKGSRFFETYPDSSLMVRALFEFFKMVGWKNIAVITEAQGRMSYYFAQLVERLHALSVQDSTNVTVIACNYATNVSRLSLTRIVLVSVGEKMVTELLCSMYREDLMWPKHVWIIHTHRFETIIKLNASCDIETALENVLFFNENILLDSITEDDEIFHAKMISHNTSERSGISNYYSFLLHDLVWSIALALNNTLVLGSESGLDISQHRQINIFQVRNLSTVQVALYSGINNFSFTDLTFRTIVPSDELRITTVGVSLAYTATFLTEISAGFVLLTVMLIAYSCFRNEPEVKSTSFSLSLLMFLGSYLMLVYLSILLYFHQPWAISDATLNGLCISLNWFSGLGIPFALIFVTALVKILRIYHIFSKSTPSALSKKCSDTYLALYVVLIILPLILMHSLWTNLDPYLGFFKVSAQLDSIQYEKQCKSNYTLLWYALLAGYILTLFLILFIVAVKMKNIRISHFNDTKKVTILVSCYFVDLIMTLILWRILYTAVNAYVAAIVLHIGHIIGIILCQVLLFVPKVLPPLVRRLKKIN